MGADRSRARTGRVRGDVQHEEKPHARRECTHKEAVSAERLRVRREARAETVVYKCAEASRARRDSLTEIDARGDCECGEAARFLHGRSCCHSTLPTHHTRTQAHLTTLQPPLTHTHAHTLTSTHTTYPYPSTTSHHCHHCHHHHSHHHPHHHPQAGSNGCPDTDLASLGRVAGAVQQVPPGAVARDGVHDARRADGVHERRLAAAYLITRQHDAVKGAQRRNASLRKQEAVFKVITVRSPLPGMSSILPCPPCLPQVIQAGGVQG